VKPAWLAPLAAAAGSDIRSVRAVAGGDVHDAACAVLADGRRLFVKSHPRPPAGIFGIEARGLAWLAEAGAIRIPRVVAVCDDDPAFLALEWIDSASPAPDHDVRLGRGLAALHQSGAPGFGLEHASYLAVFPQDNAPLPSWPHFYAERRLAPQLARAVDLGRATPELRRGMERLLARIVADPTGVCGPDEPPARLHGDLWSGNALTDEHGLPCLIDPAVYGGHREVDLAMMRLFGGFADACFAAYAEAHPLAPGHPERVGLYQLYPLLVHVNLFGGGYAARLSQTLRTLA
jgi:fructosamine-3-kinase